MKRLPLFGLIATLFLTSVAQAVTLEKYDFTGQITEQRFRTMIDELRCLVCQNESLGSSNAELAGDLRDEVYELMDQGMNDDEVIEYLVARYGDFVRYDPPVTPATWPLWFGPFVLLLLALAVLYFNLKRRAGTRETTLSDEEQARVQRLLNDKDA
jgi:cytochrome c-type biogenesis protein CcmH